MASRPGMVFLFLAIGLSEAEAQIPARCIGPCHGEDGSTIRGLSGFGGSEHRKNGTLGDRETIHVKDPWPDPPSWETMKAPPFNGGRGKGKSRYGEPPPDPKKQHCTDTYYRCLDWAGGSVERMRTLYSNTTDRYCTLNHDVRSPFLAEARGGHLVKDLVQGLVRVPPFTAKDWEFSCDPKRTPHCYGPAYDSCMASYRSDMPAASVGPKGIGGAIEVSISAIKGSLTGNSEIPITYTFDPSEGWHTAMRKMGEELFRACETRQTDCLERIAPSSKKKRGRK